MFVILKNKVVWYTFSRYFTYAIQFVASLLIAKYLGAYYLGVWGFITLVLQYLARINFGISNATNAFASIYKSDEKYVEKVVGVGVSLLLLLCLLLLFFFMASYSLGIEIGKRYSFIHYLPYVVAIAVFSHYNLFFSNIFRVYGKLFAIAISQSLIPVSWLIAALFFKGEQLLLALVIANLVAAILSFFLFVFTSPVPLKPQLCYSLAREIQKKGLYLFIYNASFYLIIITTRSFVSKYYTITEFGYFTFAYTLANTVLLLYQSMSFLIFPKLLNRFAINNNERANALLTELRGSYVTICHFSVHLFILLYPFLLFFFSEYQSTGRVFVVTALTIVIYTNAFGYQGLIIAKEKETVIAFVSFGALVLNVILNFILILLVKVPFELVMLATMSTYLIYVFILAKFGRKIIGVTHSLSATFFDVFNVKWMLPFVISILITIYSYKFHGLYFIPLIIFITLNFKGLLGTYSLAKKILKNPNVIDI